MERAAFGQKMVRRAANGVADTAEQASRAFFGGRDMAYCPAPGGRINSVNPKMA